MHGSGWVVRGGGLVRDSSDVGLPLVEIRRAAADSGKFRTVVAYDDDPDVELTADDGGGDAPWEVRWSVPKAGSYSVRVRGRASGGRGGVQVLSDRGDPVA